MLQTGRLSPVHISNYGRLMLARGDIAQMRGLRRDYYAVNDPQGTYDPWRVMNWEDGLDNVYRVELDTATNRAVVVCLGISATDSDVDGIYSDRSTLPDWIKDKLSVLSIMKVDPPQTRVVGVGMRVSENVFWVER
jgi:hypothetical protein